MNDQILDEVAPEVSPAQRTDLPELLVRLKAMLIDGILLIGFMAILTSVFEAFDYQGDTLRIAAYILIFLYEPAMVSTGGTVGHRLMKIRVKQFSNESKNPLFPLALVRVVGKALLGWISLITVSTNKSKRAIHDLLSNTIVVFHRKND